MNCYLREAACLLLIASIVLFSTTTFGQTAKQPTNILMLSAVPTAHLDAKLAKRLGDEGIRITIGRLADPLSADLLKQYHLVIIADWEGQKLDYFLQDQVKENLNIERNLGVIEQYVKDGGGLFFTPSITGNPSAYALSEFLKPYGAQVKALQVRDDAHAFITKYPPGRYPDEYAWTTDIVSHPTTEGVARLLYGQTQMRWDDIYATPVMTFADPAWTVVIRGMDSSTAAKGVDYTTWLPQGKQPAIAAVRAYGKGRVAAFAPASFFTLTNAYDEVPTGNIGEMHTGKIDGAVLEKGDGKQGSDGLKLLLNTFHWLAEPARAANMGAPNLAAKAPVAVENPAWMFNWNPNSGTRWFKMLVGAHSAYSDGSGTVAEYAAAARKAGVSALVFTESLERFDPAKWEQFLADCRAASDGTLVVMPGLDMKDGYGARYLLLNSPLFPPAYLLTPDGKTLAKVQYLNLTFPNGTTVVHRVTSSPIPDQLLKHFQGISIYTYRNGALEDNSMLTYQWQMFRLSNPIPFVVHEMSSPGELEKEAVNGQQMYSAADTLANLRWYLNVHGIAHAYECPVHFQVSDGPRITAYASSPFLSAESDAPITEVSVYENYNLYRRWTPGTKTFTVDKVKLPVGHVTWCYAVVRDANGHMAISPAVKSGNQIRFTARCTDRQNWFFFPNIYTGTLVEDFDISVPTFGTDEGRGLLPQQSGPQRGDDMAAILDFPYASSAVFMQDVLLDQRYYRATFADTGFDATPAQATTRSRVYDARIRYAKFFLPGAGDRKIGVENLPLLKDITIRLRMPVEPSGDLFPIITPLDIRDTLGKGDMSYAYTDPTTGKPVTGTLKSGHLDLPKGGRVGGFIALSDGIRISAEGYAGFAPPAVRNGALPVGTTWHATFTVVPPADAEKWRAIMGLTDKTPFEIKTIQGKLDELAFVASCQAKDYGIAGTIKTTLNAPTRVPFKVAGVNYNWDSGIWRPGAEPEEIGVFEGNAWAQLNVAQPGDFYIGNLVLASNPNLRLGIHSWKPDSIEIEANNPTDQPITASIWTATTIRDHLQAKTNLTLAPGSSQTIMLTGK